MTSAVRPCPACGAADAAFAFHVGGYDHARCVGCGTIFVARLPDAASIESTYLAPDYHSSARGEELRMRAEADARAAVLRKFGVRRVLEIGCGPGHFLDACRDVGMQVEGVDRAPTAAGPLSRGHTIHAVWFHDLGPIEPRFDALALWEVIEHVAAPGELLERARRWLRPGGFVALSTPSASGLPARAMGPRFPMICPPDHLSVFSRTGLQRLLAAAGFDPVRWTSFSGLGRPQLRRGLQRYVLGASTPARVAAAGLALLAEPVVRAVDRAGFGSAFEVYAVAR